MSFYTTVSEGEETYLKDKAGTKIKIARTNLFDDWSDIKFEKLSRDQLQIIYKNSIKYSGSSNGGTWLRIAIHRIEQMESRDRFESQMASSQDSFESQMEVTRDSLKVSRHSLRGTWLAIFISLAASVGSICFSYRDDQSDSIWMKKQEEQNAAVIEALKEISLQIKELSKSNDLKKVQKKLDRLIKNSTPPKK